MPVRAPIRLALAVLAIPLLTAACERPDEPLAEATAAPAPAVAPKPYAVPMRDDETVAGLLAEACNAARTRSNARVLVEFSAAWCSDCRKLDGMKQAPALAAELADWSHVTINVGRFDRHRDLLDALAIRSIAHWSIFEPEDCDAPITRWPRLARRTLEVSSGRERDLGPADLARWLAEQRRG